MTRPEGFNVVPFILQRVPSVIRDKIDKWAWVIRGSRLYPVGQTVGNLVGKIPPFTEFGGSLSCLEELSLYPVVKEPPLNYILNDMKPVRI